MKVYGFVIGQDGAVMEIKNSLKEEQRFVEGLIECVSLTDELDLICNDEGKLLGLQPTVAWLENGELVEIIMGNCFVCRYTEDGDFCSIKESDVAVITEKLKEIALILNGVVYLRHR
ncbi:DUF3846 domain-containing protein [Konateibacter massiliensis]|uniref:DUF3846 domain-containing protein n=1 Tax=Konateibacter massiliensis TaxID=2002841 RepID=UPI000C1571B1|nr:DUF3846 domain-containing protein [Konateibacter massiliensis]